MGEISDKITQIIEARFAPSHLELIDQSDRHKGHAGHDGRGESHFRLTVVSEMFAGKSRPERHRMVYEALDPLVGGRVHALSLVTKTPEELAPLK